MRVFLNHAFGEWSILNHVSEKDDDLARVTVNAILRGSHCLPATRLRRSGIVSVLLKPVSSAFHWLSPTLAGGVKLGSDVTQLVTSEDEK